MEGFTPLNIKLDLQDGDWADLEGALGGDIDRVGVAAGATTAGKPGVALAIRLEDGRQAVVWTTWNLFYTAARAIEARYGPAA